MAQSIIHLMILSNGALEKNCIVKIPKQSNCLTRFILHKQRFFCKNCSNTFIVETSLVEKNKNISNNTDLQIKLELMEKTIRKGHC